MRYHREQRTGGTTRQALALLPVADGIDRHAETRRELDLRQLRTAAQIANAGHVPRRNLRLLNGSPCRRERDLAAVAKFDDRPSAFNRSRCIATPRSFPYSPTMVADAR